MKKTQLFNKCGGAGDQKKGNGGTYSKINDSSSKERNTIFLDGTQNTGGNSRKGVCMGLSDEGNVFWTEMEGLVGLKKACGCKGSRS